MLFWQLKEVMEFVLYLQNRGERGFSFKGANVFAMKVKFRNL